jgi:hypothetical protein
MNAIHLPESFVLPTHETNNQVINRLDAHIAREGGARSFLGRIRMERQTHFHFHSEVLLPLTNTAMEFEHLDAEKRGDRSDPDHRIGRAVLSGMLFGHFINEPQYPSLYRVDPYNNPHPVNLHLLPQPDREHYFEMVQINDTEGFRYGVRSMSALAIEPLADTSIKQLNTWGSDIVGSERCTHFMTGVGAALYLAWDAYSDLLIASGRGSEVTSLRLPEITQANPGETD